MPVLRLHKYQHKVDVNKLKLDGVEDKLLSMGYACNNCTEMIAVIDMFHLDESQFDFPYGSYEEFKKHVSELEVSDNFEMSDEEYEQFQKRIKEGQTWVTY